MKELEFTIYTADGETELLNDWSIDEAYKVATAYEDETGDAPIIEVMVYHDCYPYGNEEWTLSDLIDEYETVQALRG